MNVHRVRSYSEWQEYRTRIQGEAGERASYEVFYRDRLMSGAREGENAIGVPAYSYTAKKHVNLIMDTLYAGSDGVNWRERLVCPITGLNNRIRASVHLLDMECEPFMDARIYLTEQVTPLYSYLKSIYPHLIGSEYLGETVVRGDVNLAGIRNEDMTALTFASDSFDVCLTFDCLEHIPDFERAFGELYRVLKVGGKLLWSAPFDLNSKENVIRAIVGEDGSVLHIFPPEYHGNPVSEGGSLCFTVFGWAMLDRLKEIGFSDSYAVLYWSREFGYLGGTQVMFVARK